MKFRCRTKTMLNIECFVYGFFLRFRMVAYQLDSTHIGAHTTFIGQCPATARTLKCVLQISIRDSLNTLTASLYKPFFGLFDNFLHHLVVRQSGRFVRSP